MYPFPQNVTPAVRTHVDAQTAFLNDMSKSLFKSFQQMCDLNIQLMQTLIEETALASRHVLSAERQTDVLNAATSRAQPTTDKLRAYQQHVTRLAADSQVEIARVTEQHVQNTTRTARALADEVARDATEQTERNLRAQQDSARQFADPFFGSGDGAASPNASGDNIQGTTGNAQTGQHATGSAQAATPATPGTPSGQRSERGERGATTH